MRVAEGTWNDDAAKYRHQAVRHAEQQREHDEPGHLRRRGEDRQRQRDAAEHEQAQGADRQPAAERQVDDPPRHLRRSEPDDDGHRLRLAQALRGEGRHDVRPGRHRGECVKRERRREQPEARLAQRLVQRCLGLCLAGGRRQGRLGRAAQRPGVQRCDTEHQHRADDLQRAAPLAVRDQPDAGRECKRAGEPRDQRQRRDALGKPIGKAFCEHAERRVVHAHRHGRAEQCPGAIERCGCGRLRPDEEPQGADDGAGTQHPAAVAAVDRRASGVGRRPCKFQFLPAAPGLRGDVLCGNAAGETAHGVARVAERAATVRARACLLG